MLNFHISFWPNGSAFSFRSESIRSFPAKEEDSCSSVERFSLEAFRESFQVVSFSAIVKISSVFCKGNWNLLPRGISPRLS